MIRTSKNYMAIPPGETIKELMENNGITKNDLANKMNIDISLLEHLLEGTMILTYDIATSLEAIFNVDKKFWEALEFEYRKDLEKVSVDEEEE